MAGDLPPESDDDLTGIVRGDIGEPLPLSSLDLAPPPDLVASLSPWQSPLRQASLAALPRAVSPAPLSPWESPLRQAVNASQNASQLGGSSARGLPSSEPTRAAEPEKPVTPGFAVWRSPAMFGSPRVQSDAEAPSPPVVSGVQEGLVRQATQTASRAILGAGAVDGLLATRNENPPPTREPWQEMSGDSTCAGKSSRMGDLSSLAKGGAASSCDCSPCGGPFVPEIRKDFENRVSQSEFLKNYNKREPSPSDGRASNIFSQQNFKQFGHDVINGQIESRKIRPPNAQPESPNLDENFPSFLLKDSRVLIDSGGWSRSRTGILIERKDQSGFQIIKIITTGPWREFCFPSQPDRSENISLDYNIGIGDHMDDLEFKNGYLVKNKNFVALPPRPPATRKISDE